MEWRLEDPISALENIYGLIYFFLAKEMLDTFGEEGEVALRRALTNYGHFRGKILAEHHQEQGIEKNVKNLFENYDMPQDPRTDRKRYVLNKKEKQSEYYSCQYADMWKELEGSSTATRIGLIYCEAFHPAMYEGYHEKIKVSLPKTLTNGDKCCRFEVKMED